jgi:hypothetical protein
MSLRTQYTKINISAITMLILNTVSIFANFGSLSQTLYKTLNFQNLCSQLQARINIEICLNCVMYNQSIRNTYLLQIFHDLKICITSVFLQFLVESSLLAVGVIQDNVQHYHAPWVKPITRTRYLQARPWRHNDGFRGQGMFVPLIFDVCINRPASILKLLITHHFDYMTLK